MSVRSIQRALLHYLTWTSFAAGLVFVATVVSTAGEATPAAVEQNVSYGPEKTNVLDFWRVNSPTPAPMVVFFHRSGGNKAEAERDAIVRECLDAGVSFASVDYRDTSRGTTIPDALRDCARAIQFLRANAQARNVDSNRIAAYGRSFGGSASLWLAFHDDMADPKSPDPVLRQSTRLAGAGSFSGQFSFDPFRWTEVFGPEVVDRLASAYKDPRLWGFDTIEQLRSPAGQKVRADCDIISLVTKDDPPVFLVAQRPNALTTVEEFVHHPKLTQLLSERCLEVGVPVIADIPALKLGPPAGEPATWREFVFRVLKMTPRAQP